MSISTIIPALLNTMVDRRVWQNATPDNLPRDAQDRIMDFIVWTLAGGQDAEYVGQVMGSHTNARVQINVFSRSSITADAMIREARDRLLASDYTVGVYGSPVGTYDAARKLSGRFQQFSIWYRQ